MLSNGRSTFEAAIDRLNPQSQADRRDRRKSAKSGRWQRPPASDETSSDEITVTEWQTPALGNRILQAALFCIFRRGVEEPDRRGGKPS